MTEADMAALDDFEAHPSFTERERLALRYTDKLMYYAHTDLDDLYRQMQQHFTAAELIELGALIGLNTGFIGHLIRSWDL